MTAFVRTALLLVTALAFGAGVGLLVGQHWWTGLAIVALAVPLLMAATRTAMVVPGAPARWQGRTRLDRAIMAAAVALMGALAVLIPLGLASWHAALYVAAGGLAGAIFRRR